LPDLAHYEAPTSETLVIKDAIANPDLTRVRLSDMVGIINEILIREKYLTKTEVESFETEYTRGAQLLRIREHGESARQAMFCLRAFRTLRYLIRNLLRRQTHISL